MIRIQCVHIPYARHYKPRLVFFNPFFTAANILERLVLQSVLYFLIIFYLSDLYEDSIQKE
jgi:hypothetical protein